MVHAHDYPLRNIFKVGQWEICLSVQFPFRTLDLVKIGQWNFTVLMCYIGLFSIQKQLLCCE